MPTHIENVFVVTYGRSGSTLLAGLLNSLPGYLIRGENYNFLYPIFLSYTKIVEAKKSHGGESADSETDPWWGVNDVCVDTYVSDIRRLVDNVLIGEGKPKPRVYGFKEIRYPWVTKQGDLSEYLSFIRMLYPKSRFIMNYREHEDVLRSGWWARRDSEEKLKGRELLEKFEADTRSYVRSNSDFCFEINYEDLCSISANLRQLFDFIGEPYEEERVKRVLATRYSYDNRPDRKYLSEGQVEVPGNARGRIKKLISRDS
jgi:hypothetical protein